MTLRRESMSKILRLLVSMVLRRFGDTIELFWLHCGIPNQALGNNLRRVSIVTVTILQRLVCHGMATYFQIELMLWFLFSY